MRKVLLVKQFYAMKNKDKEKYKKRFWVRQIHSERREKGEFYLLVKEMLLYDREYFFRCFRMTPSTYEQLLKWVAPIIQKKATKMRQPIEASERLCVTLRYCVTGDSHVTIAASYRISPSCVGKIIAETCQAIWSVICKEVFLDVYHVLKMNGHQLQMNSHTSGIFLMQLVHWMENML